METKAEAIKEILGIARKHGLTPVEIEAAFKEAGDGTESPSKILGRILGYLGG